MHASLFTIKQEEPVEQTPLFQFLNLPDRLRQQNKDQELTSIFAGDVVLLKYLFRPFQYCGVFQVYNAAIGTGFQVPFHDLAFLILVGAEVIAHGLFVNVKFLRDTSDAAGRQSVFNAAKLLKSDIHTLRFWLTISF